MTELDKIRGVKGCKKCPGYLRYLGRELILTAYHLHEQKKDGWQIPYERAVGVFLAIGLLEHGVPKDGDVQAEIPPPPDINIEEWAGGPRRFHSGFQMEAKDMSTSRKGKKPVKPIAPGPARKPKSRKQGTVKKGGYDVLSMKDLEKKRRS